jgi:hypothetical protein
MIHYFFQGLTGPIIHQIQQNPAVAWVELAAWVEVSAEVEVGQDDERIFYIR